MYRLMFIYTCSYIYIFVHMFIYIYMTVADDLGLLEGREISEWNHPFQGDYCIPQGIGALPSKMTRMAPIPY